MDLESDAAKQAAGLTDRLGVIVIVRDHHHAHLEFSVDERAQTSHGLAPDERLGKFDFEQHRWGFDAPIALHVRRSPSAGRGRCEPRGLGVDVPRSARREVARERSDALVVQCEAALEVLEPIGVADDRTSPRGSWVGDRNRNVLRSPDSTERSP